MHIMEWPKVSVMALPVAVSAYHVNYHWISGMFMDPCDSMQVGQYHAVMRYVQYQDLDPWVSDMTRFPT